MTKVQSKKEQTALSVRALLKRFFGFFGDVKAELRKISWTNREELRVYTKIVVLTTFVFGMMVFFADLFIKNALEAISYVLRIIGG